MNANHLTRPPGALLERRRRNWHLLWMRAGEPPDPNELVRLATKTSNIRYEEEELHQLSILGTLLQAFLSLVSQCRARRASGQA
jgi:hypothetical protein